MITIEPKIINCHNCVNDLPDGMTREQWVEYIAYLDDTDQSMPRLLIVCKRCDMNVIVVTLAPQMLNLQYVPDISQAPESGNNV